MTYLSYVEAGELSKACSVFGIHSQTSGAGSDGVGEALTHEVPNELFEGTRFGYGFAFQKPEGALDIVLFGKELVGVARDIIARNTTERKLSFYLGPPPPAPLSLLNEISSEAGVIDEPEPRGPLDACVDLLIPIPVEFQLVVQLARGVITTREHFGHERKADAPLKIVDGIEGLVFLKGKRNGITHENPTHANGDDNLTRAPILHMAMHFRHGLSW